MKTNRKTSVPRANLTRLLPPFYYQGPHGYWMENARGGWVPINETSLRRELRLAGYSTSLPDGERLPPLDLVISRIQKEHDVAYSGPLAGYRAGLHEVFERRILVTSSPRFVEPAEGEWGTLRGVIERMLGEQSVYFYGWLKLALAAVRASLRQPGQVLALAGEKDSGKSLLQMLITTLLGGRQARPFRHMSGRSDFNSELFGAEHLVVEDEAGSTTPQARRWLAARLKEFTVNGAMSCHAKGREALALSPIQRLTVSVNDEPEFLRVLPPICGGLEDKIMLLQTERHPMPMPTETAQQQAAFMATLRAELAAFVHWLEQWTIPEELRCARVGIRSFHHPALLAVLNSLPKEIQFLTLLDRALFADGHCQQWKGTAAELEMLLVSDESELVAEARTLLDSATACGVLLGRLTELRGSRVRHDRSAYRRGWIIDAPEV